MRITWFKQRDHPSIAEDATLPLVTRMLGLGLLTGDAVLTRAKLRDQLAVQNERLGVALESLERAGRLCRTPAGWKRLD